MLTNLEIKRALAAARRGGKRREVYDGGAMGLVLVCQPSGRASWAYRYRRPNSSTAKAKLTLGPYDASDRAPSNNAQIGEPLTLSEARVVAGKQQVLRQRGVDVAAERTAEKQRRKWNIAEAEANNFAVGARLFIDEYARPETRDWRSTARMLGWDYQPDQVGEPSRIKNGLAERWQQRHVADITADDLADIVYEAKQHGIPGLARKRKRQVSNSAGRLMGAALSKCFAWLKAERFIKVNPALGLDKPKAPRARNRTLSAVELRWFWQACEALDVRESANGADRGAVVFAPLLHLLVLTGCRRSEVAGMRDNELTNSTQWEIPGARTKNHRLLLVPLSELACKELRRVTRIPHSPFIFTTNGKTPVSGWSKMKRRLDAAMLKVAREDDPQATIEPWRLHDLRRTAATGMVSIGIQPHIVEAALNHLSGHKAGVAGVYNVHEYLPEKTAALDRWAAHVEAIVSGSAGSNVIPFAAAGA